MDEPESGDQNTTLTTSAPASLTESLTDARRELRLLFDNVTDYAILVLDAEGRYVDWNTGAERILGYSREEALGQPSALIFTPEDQANGIVQKELENARVNGSAEDERWHLRKDGSRFWASGVMTALFDRTGQHRGFAKLLRNLTERKQLEEALAWTREDLEARVTERTAELERANAALKRIDSDRRRLLRQIVSAQEQERSRIARELHDDMGQYVTALLLAIGNLSGLPGISTSTEGQAAVRNLRALAKEVAERVHRISFELRPTSLDDLGLHAALRNHVAAWTGWCGIPVQLEVIGMEEGHGTERDDGPGRLPAEIETTVYRILQEALTNIMRHADGTTRVQIVVQRSGRELRASVEDDGPGFDEEAALETPQPGQRRMGLLGMRERAELVGGSLTIESSPGAGTTVFLRIPLERDGP